MVRRYVVEEDKRSLFSDGRAEFPPDEARHERLPLCVLLLSGLALLIMALPGTMYVRYICRDIPQTEPLLGWLFYALATFFNLYYGYY